MNVEINHNCKDFTSYRAERVKSLFNCTDGHSFHLNVDMPLDAKPWSVGLIVGPSGSGKTSIATKLGKLYQPKWQHNKPLIDSIAPKGSFDDVTAALTSVGLGSVPTWLRPYHVLSNGEQFRANLAKLVAEKPSSKQPVVIDEFTSVVDRQIAKVGASAFAKAWRRTDKQVVLASCHYDIVDWLQPDWTIDTATGEFSWHCLRRRPPIELTIRKVSGRVWRYFEPHHYLKLPNMVAAQHYVGFVGDQPVAHMAFSPQFNVGNFMRGCRLVVMPEWQGVGVGIKFLEGCCRLMLQGENRWKIPCFSFFHTSHPGLVSALRHRGEWLHISGRLFGDNKTDCIKSLEKSKSSCIAGFGGHLRAVHGFKFIGNENDVSQTS